MNGSVPFVPLPQQQPLDVALQQQLQALNLREFEYRKIVHFLRRDPNFTELCMFSALWSEHCSYKHTKHLLKKLPTQGAQIVQGPGENAGIVDCGNGLHVAFKVESHNHPTYVEPFQGAATGVGGILRDILTMNARPVALLNALRFGPLTDAANRYRLFGAVAGIGTYGNCMGVPTVAGDVFIHPSYSGNPLVNAMAVGIMQPGGMMSAGAQGIGNPVVYVGSPTGRDGMGGASFASRALAGDQSQQDRPAVQVGDPFLEKLLLEACLEAFATGCVVAAQDMGAAGLTCATAEMAAKGGVGMHIQLDWVPVREPGMLPWEYLSSESQERMLMVLQKGQEEPVLAIFRRWGVPACIIGQVTEGPNLWIDFQGQRVVDLPARLLTDMAPEYAPSSRPEEPAAFKYRREGRLATEGLPALAWETVPQVLGQLLASPNVCSRQPVFSQYDRHVRNSTLLASDHLTAGVVRLRTPDNQPTGRALAMALEGNPRLVALNPYTQSQGVVAHAARKLAACGATPLATTDNLNFGDPEDPAVYYQLFYSVEGIKDACLALNTPVTGGNVSLYNTNATGAILPSPVIGMVGLLADETVVVPATMQRPGHGVALLGRFRPALGGSEYQALKTGGDSYGYPPSILMREEALLLKVLSCLTQQRLLASAQPLSLGGLLVTLTKCTFNQHPLQLGFSVGLDAAWALLPANQQRLDGLLFGETHGSVLLSYSLANEDTIRACVKQLTAGDGPASEIVFTPLGHVTETPVATLSWQGQTLTVSLEDLAQGWQSGLESSVQ